MDWWVKQSALESSMSWGLLADLAHDVMIVMVFSCLAQELTKDLKL